MCSVIGYHPVSPSEETVTAFGRLFLQSQIRGLHAFGLANIDGVHRSFQANDIPSAFNPTLPTIAHTRYCQSGDWQVMENNQPIIVGSMALAMNGVLHMGTKTEFEATFGVTCAVDNDSEVFLRRLEQGQTPSEFLAEISGSFAATWLKDERLYAARNPRRPLYRSEEFGGVWFASTADIFRRAGFTTVTSVKPYEVQVL
jgi:glutamine phosphoribosylpyrophosphate amidotransferase